MYGLVGPGGTENNIDIQPLMRLVEISAVPTFPSDPKLEEQLDLVEKH